MIIFFYLFMRKVPTYYCITMGCSVDDTASRLRLMSEVHWETNVQGFYIFSSFSFFQTATGTTLIKRSRERRYWECPFRHAQHAAVVCVQLYLSYHPYGRKKIWFFKCYIFFNLRKASFLFKTFIVQWFLCTGALDVKL